MLFQLSNAAIWYYKRSPLRPQKLAAIFVGTHPTYVLATFFQNAAIWYYTREDLHKAMSMLL